MTEGIQKELENIGKYGCGFLCLCHKMGIADSELLFYYRQALKKDLVDSECYVKDWGKLATFLCPDGQTYRCEKSNLKDRKAAFYIEYWYNPRTKLRHFKLKDWDSLGESVTVKEGMIESYRNFYLC
jgi:hypothetical protein